MQERKNFKAFHSGPLESLQERKSNGVRGKFLIGEELGLTGCEVSLNRLPAGKGIPLVHAHKSNEEVYIIIRGSGTFYVDGEEFPISEGSIVRVDPAGERAWKAGSEDLYFICIQAARGSLNAATMADAIICETKTEWMK
jgi:mannose-6-phosphate isomerase-like protein (cupin superfamily)